jgi:regulator of protease activity HflC (stomatin/prohibitin superfamily)
MTRDHQVVQITLHVFYSVDPRKANPDFETQELQYNDDEWKNVIQREMQSVLIEVARNYYLDDLLTTDGLVRLRFELSSALVDTVQDLGIAIHETHGVRIDQLLPHRKMLQAMIEADAATCLGEAAQKRLQPLMNAVGPIPAPGWQALLVTMASAIVNHDDPQKLEATPKFARTVSEVKDGSGPGGTPPPSRN